MTRKNVEWVAAQASALVLRWPGRVDNRPELAAQIVELAKEIAAAESEAKGCGTCKYEGPTSGDDFGPRRPGQAVSLCPKDCDCACHVVDSRR